MQLEAWPWARDNLTAADRAEIASTKPRDGRVHLSRDGRAGSFKAVITHVVHMKLAQGYGKTPIAAFRDALAKEPA